MREKGIISLFLSKISKIGFIVVISILFLSTINVYSADLDGDGISDQDETAIYHTDPNNHDTDGDGINDGRELAFWRNKWSADYDGDRLNGLLDHDSDNDGFSDGEEMNSGSNPGNADSIPTEPPLFSIHKLVVGFDFHEDYEGWMEVLGGSYSHERWLQVNWPDFNYAGGATRVTSGDIDGDGKDEIIIGLGPVVSEPSLPGGVFEILDDDFTHLAWGEIGWPDYNEANGESWPSTGDIDGDGKDEIIIGLGPGGGGRLEIFDYSSAGLVHKAWTGVNWEDYNKTSGETRPACGDIDGDGKDEIIVGLGPVASEPSLPGGVFEILDDDLTHIAWGKIGWSDYNEINGESWPGTGDIDGDGKDEIIIGLGPGGEGKFETLRLSSSDVVHMDWGEITWQDYKDLYGETHPSSADVDFDGKDEIVVGLGKGGDGWIDILDDASQGYSLLRSVQTGLVEYGEVSGETWPSVRFSITLSDNDSDKDGLTDEEEARLGLLATSLDTDGDGLADGVEFGYGTDPKLADTDGDGYSDYEETLAGTDPLNASSVPGIDSNSTSRTTSGGSATATVTLAWDPNTEADLAGYRVAYGLKSRNYASTVDVSNKTSYTLTNLTPGRTYYFAVKAYNTTNQESAYSEEISHMLSSTGKVVTISPPPPPVGIPYAQSPSVVQPGGGVEVSICHEY